MATISEDLTFTSSLDLARDQQTLHNKIDCAKRMASRRYIFVGETHNATHDKLRTIAAAEHYAGDADVIVVAERGIFGDRGDIEVSANVVNETDRKSVSSAYVRNVSIAQQIIEAATGDAAQRPHHLRPVVILFGQDHERHIRNELMRQMPATDKICWWSFPSIEDQIAALPDRDAGLAGFSLVGFCHAAADPGARIRLFHKNRLNAAFTINLTAPFFTSFRHPLYAVYGANAHAPYALLRTTLQDAPTGTMTLDNLATAKLILVTNRTALASLLEAEGLAVV